MALLKVSSRSNPNAVAGAFAAVVREEGRAEVHVVGAGAINQAIKAVAIARGFLEEQGIDLVVVPSFVDITIDGEERTAMRLLVGPRTPPVTPPVTPPATPVVATEAPAPLALTDDGVGDLRIEHTVDGESASTGRILRRRLRPARRG